MRKYLKSKLLYQVALAILVCSILFSFAVGLVLIHNSTIHITEEVENKYFYLVNNYANQIDMRIQKSEAILQSLDVYLMIEEGIDEIFTDYELRDVITSDMQMNLNELAKYQESTYDVFVYLQSNDRTEEIILSSLENAKSSDFEEIRAITSNAVMEKRYDIRGFWLDYNDEMLLSYLQPVVVDEKLVGFIGARHRKFDFLCGITEVSEFSKGDLVLYDSSYNTIVLHHQLSGRLNTDIRPILSEVEKVASGIIGFEDSDRGELIIAHSRLNNGWMIMIQMSKSDVFVRTYELIKLLIMFIIIGSIISLLIAVEVSGRITGPIEDLAKEMRRIGEGDYNTQLSEKYMIYNNEIGILATTVETMRFNLLRNIKEIEGNAKNLEVQVKDRTKELVTTNEYLEQSLGEIEENKAEMILVNDELEQTLENLRGTQEQLIESRKLSAISDLVNGVAHQLNTPIGVSITAVSYLEKELNDFYKKLKSEGLMNDDIKTELKDIAETTQLTMKNLSQARDILDTFKYITSDSSTEKLTSLELCEFLGDLTSALMVKAEYVKFKLNFACEKEVLVKSYPSVLTQIMTNLISNSIIHGFKDRNDGVIDLLLEERGRFFIIDYRDNGIGISEENIERVFDPFFSTVMSRERIGLGLSIVYNYVTVKMKGRIKCESELGNGTRFIIQIPK